MIHSLFSLYNIVTVLILSMLLIVLSNGLPMKVFHLLFPVENIVRDSHYSKLFKSYSSSRGDGKDKSLTFRQGHALFLSEDGR